MYKINFIFSTLYFSPPIIIGLTYLFRRRTLRFAYEYENEIKLLGPFMRLFLYIFTTRFFYGANGNKTMKGIYIFCFQASLISFYISFTIRNGHYFSLLFLFNILESLFHTFFEVFVGFDDKIIKICQCDNAVIKTKKLIYDDVQKNIKIWTSKSVLINPRVVRRVIDISGEIEDVDDVVIKKNFVNSSFSITPINVYVQYGLFFWISLLFIDLFQSGSIDFDTFVRELNKTDSDNKKFDVNKSKTVKFDVNKSKIANFAKINTDKKGILEVKKKSVKSDNKLKRINRNYHPALRKMSERSFKIFNKVDRVVDMYKGEGVDLSSGLLRVKTANFTKLLFQLDPQRIEGIKKIDSFYSNDARIIISSYLNKIISESPAIQDKLKTYKVVTINIPDLGVSRMFVNSLEDDEKFVNLYVGLVPYGTAKAGATILSDIQLLKTPLTDNDTFRNLYKAGCTDELNCIGGTRNYSVLANKVNIPFIYIIQKGFDGQLRRENVHVTSFNVKAIGKSDEDGHMAFFNYQDMRLRLNGKYKIKMQCLPLLLGVSPVHVAKCVIDFETIGAGESNVVVQGTPEDECDDDDLLDEDNYIKYLQEFTIFIRGSFGVTSKELWEKWFKSPDRFGVIKDCQVDDLVSKFLPVQRFQKY